jgi:type IV pilus assembly protein PilE
VDYDVRRGPGETQVKRMVKSGGNGGFTLIEVMVVVAIIAILATIAVPMYSEYVRRGQLTEAISNLSDYQVKMEQYFQDNRNYGSGGTCANAAPAPSWNTFAPGGARYFSYSCLLAGASGTAYTITASGTAAYAIGYAYTLTSSGTAQGTTKFKGSAVTKACWLVRGTEC